MMTQQRLLDWMATGERGLSSEAIAFAAMGAASLQTHNYPHDPSDFRRCLLLLDRVPEAYELGVLRLARVSRRWGALAKIWDELRATFVSEVGKPQVARGPAPLTYQRMRDVVDAEWD